MRCRCIVMHVVSDDDRAHARERMVEALRSGRLHTATIYQESLRACPSTRKKGAKAK